MSDHAVIADRGYRPYEGPRLPANRRFVTIARRLVRLSLRSPLVIILLIVGEVPPLIAGVVMAVASKVSSKVGNPLGAPDVGHYVGLTLTAPWGQLLTSSLMALLVAAPSIAEDVERHSLPFYLARPVSSRQYLAGKALTAGLLLGVLTVVPSLALAITNLSLSPADQLMPSLLLLLRAPLAALLLGVGLLAPALLVSAWAKRRTHAQVLYGVVLYLPWVLLRPLSSLADSWWPRLLAWPAVLQEVVRAALGQPAETTDAPVAVALLLYVVVVVGSVIWAAQRLDEQGGH